MKWYHNIYSEEVLEEMQKEAERRVEESRKRARLLAGESFPQSAAAPQQFSPPSPAPPSANGFCSGEGSPQNPFSAISEMLSGFGGDKLIIIAVLWLLWNEHADAKLLIALVYIML